jgi:thioredoxin-dependent peroxiredoxin
VHRQRLALFGLLITFATLAASCSRSAGALAGDGLLPVGSPAPDIVGKDGKGAVAKLSAQKGRYAIVFFYPKDDTPGCTKEACGFRDAYDRFGKAGVAIFGVSRDSEASHRAFQDKYALPFALVADPSGEVQRAYRVPGAVVAKRVSFLVGPDGKVARVWPNVDPAAHATDVLDAIAALEHKL